MHRLFVAIRPPASIRAQLLDLMEGLPDARWQDDDQLHITLRFIGEVERHRANDIADALGGLRFPPLDLALSGVGSFERKGRIDTLWAGVQPRATLEPLHRKVDRACVASGLEPEGRAYLPHVTIARFGRASGGVDAFMARHAGLTSAPFTVERFGLYESRLSQNGATYHLVTDYPASAGTS